MAILQNYNFTGLLGGIVEALLPGSTGQTTLAGNVIGTSGITDDAVHGATTEAPGDSVQDSYNDVTASGGAISDLFAGHGLGTEQVMSEQLSAIDSAPGVEQATTTLDPVGNVVSDVNDNVVNLSESISPGASNGYTALGDVIGYSGAVDDLVSNIHDGSPSSAVLSVYKDILGPGGILNNVGDGYGTGLESLVHQSNGVEGTVPAVDVVPSSLGGTFETGTQIVDSASPGATSQTTLTGNLIGESGVVSDTFDGMSHGSLSSGLVQSYDDTFAKGGIFDNLAHGGGIGVESAIGQTSDVANSLAENVGQSAPIANDLSQVAAVVSDTSSAAGYDSAVHSDDFGSLLSGHDVGSFVDALNLTDHHF